MLEIYLAPHHINIKMTVQLHYLRIHIGVKIHEIKSILCQCIRCDMGASCRSRGAQDVRYDVNVIFART